MGGLYKTNGGYAFPLVVAAPSPALRNGEGTLHFRWNYDFSPRNEKQEIPRD